MFSEIRSSFSLWGWHKKRQRRCFFLMTCYIFLGLCCSLLIIGKCLVPLPKFLSIPSTHRAGTSISPMTFARLCLFIYLFFPKTLSPDHCLQRIKYIIKILDRNELYILTVYISGITVVRKWILIELWSENYIKIYILSF